MREHFWYRARAGLVREEALAADRRSERHQDEAGQGIVLLASRCQVCVPTWEFKVMHDMELLNDVSMLERLFLQGFIDSGNMLVFRRRSGNK